MPGGGPTLLETCIGEWDDTRACHAEEDEDSEVAEGGEVEFWVEGDDASYDPHTTREGEEHPTFSRVTKESIVKCRHHGGCD